MPSFGSWFGYVRQALEVLYYLSGIVIAIAAVRGLRQLTITRQVARENAKREAYKLAGDECRHFAHEVVPLQFALEKLIREKNIQSFTNRNFVVEKGEIKTHNFDLGLFQKELPIFSESLATFLNELEAFAIFFASGVAAEEIGYRETSTAFCHAVERYMPAIFTMRLVNVRYESTVKLYEIWHGRQLAENISSQMKKLEDAAKQLPKETIKPIGT